MLRTMTLALSLLAAPLAAQSLTVDTARGAVDVPAAPEDIVVLDFAAYDTLTALGVAATGLVRPVYLPYLEEAAQDTVPAGSLFEPDFEAIYAMQPDLIVAGGRSADKVDELSGIAPALDMTIWDDTMATGLARLATYGKIFGKEDRASALAAEFDAKLAQARAAVAGQGDALILMTNGPKLSTYGRGGRFGWLHTALDLPEAVPSIDTATHGEAVSFEFIRKADPDILIVIDRLAAVGQDGASAQATLDNALVRETAAWKAGRVIYLTPGPIYIAGGGIQSMTRTLDEVLAAFGTD